MNNFDRLDHNGTYSKTIDDYLYQDGIINPEIFKNEKIKILWILRETNKKFNLINWWGNEEYLQEKINPFDRDKKHKGTKRSTWIPVARTCYNILNKKDSTDDQELAQCLKRIAIINMKKTPGTSKITRKFFAYVRDNDNQDLIIEQIKRIAPNVIICGNTLNYFDSNKLPYRSDEKIKLSAFSKNGRTMKQNSCFLFKNLVFINPYHPSYVMNKDEYVNIVVKAFNHWNEDKDLNLTNFNFQ